MRRWLHSSRYRDNNEMKKSDFPYVPHWILLFQAGIDLGVKGLNKEVGRDLRKSENYPTTEKATFQKQEAVVRDLQLTQKNSKAIEKVTTESDDSILPQERKKDEPSKPKEKRKLPCAFCDYKTGKTSHMQRHIKAVHKFLEHIKNEDTAEVGVDEETVSKKDDIPDITLSEEVAMEESLVAANDSDVLMKRESKCGECNLSFSGQKHLRRHFLSLHTDKRYSCEECNFTTNRNDTLKTHRNTKGHKMQVYLQEETLLN